MASTIFTKSAAAAPQSLRQSIADFAAGQLGKREIRQVLIKALEIDPDCGAEIQAYLDRELHGRRLSVTDHQELLYCLQGVPSENIPTEASEDTPDQPGRYRIDSEGTLVLAGDIEPAPAPPLPEKPSGSKQQNIPQKKPSASLPVAAKLEPGKVLRERFRLDEEIASGSMGLVYKATDLLKLEAGAKSPVLAIKVINPEFANDKAALKSFQNEVANTQHLSHPNIIHLFELDRDGEHYFITMEWLEGESLDALLDRSQGSALPPVQAYAIIEQLCDALSYAHARGVVHADIKPGNVFLTKPGELKLIDFGIAHLEEELREGAPKNAEAQAIALTPAYASCECLEKAKPTAQDDLFSLAGLIYRLLSGRRVFGSLTALQAEAHGMQPVPIGGISEIRWQALSKALSFRRADRYPDVQSFATDFGQRRVAREIEPEPEPDDAIFTQTMTLDSMPEDFDFSPQDTATLDVLNDTGKLGVPDFAANAGGVGDTAKLGALPAPEQGMQLLTAVEAAGAGRAADFVEDFGGAFDDDIGDNPAHTETQDLGMLPEPINFFDDDCDDSVFVPLDEAGAGLATEQSGTGTVELAIMHDPVEPEPEAAPAPATVARAAKPAAPVKTTPSVTPGVAPKVRPKSAADETPGGRKPTVAVLAGAHKASEAQKLAGMSWFGRVVWRARKQPLRAAATVAISLMAGTLATGWLLKSGEPDGSSALSASVQRGEAVAVAVAALPAVTQQQTVVNAADTAIPGQQALNALPAELIQPEGPVNTADTGIASQQSAVPVPLNIPMPVATAPPARAATPPTPARAAAPATTARQNTAPLTTATQPAAARKVVPTTTVPAAALTNPAGATTNSTTTARLPAATTVTTKRPTAAPVTNNVPPANDYMRGLDSMARNAFAAGRLLEPADNSVASWLEKMRSSDPDSILTRTVAAELAAALMLRAEQSIGQQNFDEALRWTDSAASYGASKASIDNMRNRVAAVRQELAWQAIEKTADNAGQQSGSISSSLAARKSEAVTYERPVSLSDIEFLNYVEPVFPPQARDKPTEGWVDVRFTVDTDGKTYNIEVIGSDLPPLFAAPSVAAVEQWRFEPYIRNASAVAVNSAVRLRYVN